MLGDPWEQAITACLTVLCRRGAELPVEDQLAALATTYLEWPTEPGMTVFDTRLGFAALDAIGSAEVPTADRIVEDLHRRTAGAEDGYAARENLAHPLFTAIATGKQAQDCRALVHVCAPRGQGPLNRPGFDRVSIRAGAVHIPDELQGQLASALGASGIVIRDSHARRSNSGRTTR
jgi:hypothetical protein